MLRLINHRRLAKNDLFLPAVENEGLAIQVWFASEFLEAHFVFRVSQQKFFKALCPSVPTLFEAVKSTLKQANQFIPILIPGELTVWSTHVGRGLHVLVHGIGEVTFQICALDVGLTHDVSLLTDERHQKPH